MTLASFFPRLSLYFIALYMLSLSRFYCYPVFSNNIFCFNLTSFGFRERKCQHGRRYRAKINFNSKCCCCCCIHTYIVGSLGNKSRLSIFKIQDFKTNSRLVLKCPFPTFGAPPTPIRLKFTHYCAKLYGSLMPICHPLCMYAGKLGNLGNCDSD